MKTSLPLRVSIPLSLALLSVLFTLVQAAFDWQASRRQVDEHALRRTMLLGNLFVPPLERAVRQGDAGHGEEEVGRLASAGEFLLALVCDGTDRVLYATDAAFRSRRVSETSAGAAPALVARARETMRPQSEVTTDGTSIEAAFPLSTTPSPGERQLSQAAVLYLRSDLLAPRREAMAAVVQHSLRTGGAALLACLVGWLYLSATFTRPLHRLIRRMAAYSSGASDFRVPTEGGQELGEVGRVLNRMFSELAGKHAALRESEERFRRLFDGAADAVFLHDHEGRIIDVNRAASDYLGYSRDELLKLSVADIEVKLQPSDLGPLWQRILSGQSATVEGVHRRRDGSTFAVEIHIAPFVYGERPWFFAAARDITERKRAEAALRESEERWRTVVESQPECVKLLDAEGRVVEMNPAGLEMIQTTLDDVRGKPARGLVAQEDRANFDEMVAAVFRGETRRLVFDMIGVKGRRLTLETISVPLWESAEKSRVKFLVGVTRDITEQRRLQEQLRHAQKMEAVGQLAGGVAHDFNNILAATMLHLSLLRQNPKLDADIIAGLNEIAADADRAANLTRQLLMFGRRSALDVRVLDLNGVVENLLKMLGRLLSENVRVVFEPARALPPVEADAGMLEQVLVNLVVNARDAMPTGGRILLATEALDLDAAAAEGSPLRRGGRFVCLTVSDTGRGMDAATRERLFEPFFTTKGPGKGTGLGLATAHGIVAQHLGWLEVESEPGRGTSFRVYLPVSEKAARAGETRETSAVSSGAAAILVVEDEEKVRHVLVETLGMFGYRVLDAADGAEALVVWKNCGGAIDLLLTDMVMPGSMTGLELATHLRQQKPDLKIIISSGYSAEIAEGGSIGTADVRFLMKPYSASVLGDTVRECLQRA